MTAGPRWYTVAAVVLCLAGGLWAAPSQAASHGFPMPFSADAHITDPDAPEPIVAKYYVGAQALRVEMALMGMQQVMIVDLERDIMWTLLPEERMYMEFVLDDTDKAELGVTQPIDGPPCPEDSEARQLGTERIEGREAELWECRDPVEGVSKLWIDTKLKFPVRVEEADGATMQMRNIQEGSQPGELFQLPAGYTQMQMPGM
jgi:hypothetical protein